MIYILRYINNYKLKDMKKKANPFASGSDKMSKDKSAMKKKDSKSMPEGMKGSTKKK